MADSHLLRLGTIKGPNGILDALKHNKRELIAEVKLSDRINSVQSNLNYCLTPDNTAEKLSLQAGANLLLAGIEKPRKNAVMAVEIIFSLPIDRHQQDTRLFFMDCYAWTKRHFPVEVISFDVHLDEAAPHAHVLLLPIIDGRLQGNKLMGGRGNLARLIDLFHTEVGVKHGLIKMKSSVLSGSWRTMIAKKVMVLLKSDSLMKSIVCSCVIEDIYSDPRPYAEILGISSNQPDKITKRNKKSFVEIMTSTGKGKKNST